MKLPETGSGSGVGVLDRAVAVLEAVERGATSFTDIVNATGYTRSTTHRMIKAMQDRGLLAFADGSGYRLGPRLLDLAAAAARDLPLRDLAHPALQRLSGVTGESAQLYVREGDRRVCIDAVESANELRTIVAVGATLPLTRGSAGKVLLAWMVPSDREALVVPLDPAAAAGLRQELARTLRRGWARSVGEREAGVASVSAPVLDRRGSVVAAVSVSGPANRLGAGRGERYASAVTAAAGEIEAALGG